MKQIAFLFYLILFNAFIGSSIYAQSSFPEWKKGKSMLYYRIYPIPDSNSHRTSNKKILLYYTYGSSSSTDSYGRTKTNSTRNISHFSIDGVSQRSIGKRGKELKPYLALDPQAYKHFKNYDIQKRVSNISLVLSIISIIPVAYNVLTETENPATAPLYWTFGASLTTAFIFNGIASSNIKKSVKIYNQNAGFGYINGLEKKGGNWQNKSLSL